MTRAARVLIVSNGHGEDAVGALVGQALMRDGAEVAAFPLVGDGQAYADTPLLGPRGTLPSGGFGLRAGARQAWGDLRAGGLRLVMRQRGTLRRQAGQYARAVAVGDVYCLWMASHVQVPVIFVATAKSEYNERHRWLELLLMRRHATAVFARDRATAEALARFGVPARYEGNPLMDAIPPPGRPLPLPAGAPVVGLLPGSRADALRNLLVLLKVSRRVSATDGVAFVCAIPAHLQVVDVVRTASRSGWEVDGEYLQSGDARVLVTRDFGGALHRAEIVVGLAGTGNEQAAGLGKPVVAFPVDGARQFTPGFLRLQQRLLGDALVAALGWEDAAQAVVHLLHDPEERRRRGDAGRERMGAPGGVAKIAETIGALSSA